MATTDRFTWLKLTREVSSPSAAHEYPPDVFFKTHLGISFTRLFVFLAVGAAITDYLLVGNPDTGIPYNYPLYVGLLYIIAVLFALRKFHAIFDGAKQELLTILERTTADNAMFERESDITPADINREVNDVMDTAFSPIVILGGGFLGGIFSLAVMWLLDVFHYFPYLTMNYAYGAGHGFFYGPIIGSVYLIYKVSSEYIVDIDVLDPDGVGGYGDIGDAIIDVIILGIILVTLDFIILSSVTFIDEPLFQAAVFGLYALMLLTLLGLAVFGVMRIRKRLLEIREGKTERMREAFKAVEERYWEKLDRGESPHPEADHIETMDTMFNRLHSMELWPINLASLSRLAVSVGSSGAIALYQAGYISIPV